MSPRYPEKEVLIHPWLLNADPPAPASAIQFALNPIPVLSLWEQVRRSGVIRPSKPMEVTMLKGIALWAMGVPIFVIVLLYMFVF